MLAQGSRLQIENLGAQKNHDVHLVLWVREICVLAGRTQGYVLIAKLMVQGSRKSLERFLAFLPYAC